ncbi:MAG: hypothetical protein R3B95_14090 [Nitrospirales bacterium]|nr:hypothetical protein [Nitrospirales bacterium]
MLHRLSRWNPIRLLFFFSQRNEHERNAGRPWQRLAMRCLRTAWGASVLLISLTLTISLTDRLLANEEPLTKPSWSQEDQQILQNIHTILIAGTVQTWLNMPSPPYNVGVTLKLKLEDAGFQVVFDPEQPHDAILYIFNMRKYPVDSFKYWNKRRLSATT